MEKPHSPNNQEIIAQTSERSCVMHRVTISPNGLISINVYKFNP